jgi:hypothetical protein
LIRERLPDAKNANEGRKEEKRGLRKPLDKNGARGIIQPAVKTRTISLKSKSIKTQ